MQIIAYFLVGFWMSGPLAALEQSSDVSGESGLRTSVAEPDAFIARVEEVLSGDQLLIMLPSGVRFEVTLAGVKAPEPDSRYYRESLVWLRSQLEGQLVSALCDDAGSALPDCVIYPDDRQINIVSLFHGLSSCNGRGSVLNGADYYLKFQDMAKANKSGLWSDSR